MKQFLSSLYFNNRFFQAFFTMASAFLFAYFIPVLMLPFKIVFAILLLILAVDIALLYYVRNGVTARRILPEKLSNGDENEVSIVASGSYPFVIHIKIIDELPPKWQIRDLHFKLTLHPRQEKKITYHVRPTERGEYHFGSINCFISSKIRLVSRRIKCGESAMVPNYPSFLNLKKYDFLAFSLNLRQIGLKRIRRLGDTMEFEQIKEYTAGDDVRNLNWKATAKHAELMVNQFQDEKSQPVYCLIDKGRVMELPFNGLTLLDYAINATLVISNIVLKKHDKAGMLTFSKKLEDKVKAERRSSQMQLIMESLYNIETDFSESDFSRLYIDIKRTIKQRSLLLLFTNFETKDALERQIKSLRAINKSHLLVVIFFENSELEQFANQKAETTRQVFDKVMAEKFIYEKRLIVNELRKHGIMSLLTDPDKLTVNAINKYLEIKSRGLF